MPHTDALVAPSVPGLRRRLAGMLYESLLLLGVLSVTFMVPHLLLGMLWGISAPGWMIAINFFGVLALYFIWYWHKHGQTLAMQTWKMQLVRADGTQPRLAQLILRFVLAWLIPVAMIWLIRQLLADIPVTRWYPYLGATVGLLWALFDRDRQFLHDRLAGTRIIFKQPSALP